MVLWEGTGPLGPEENEAAWELALGAAPSTPASRAPRCPLPALDWEARPRAAEVPGARLALGQQEAEWERELLWAAQRACCWEVGSCLFSGLLAARWGLRCWGQSLGTELAWLEKDTHPLFSKIANWKLAFLEHLLCARHCAKLLISIISFNPHSNLDGRYCCYSL